MAAKRTSGRPPRGRPSGGESADEIADQVRAVFGANFRAARIKAGFTQKDIEARTGVMQHYISLIETGQPNPTLKIMVTLAAAVGKDLRSLLKPPPSPGSKKK